MSSSVALGANLTAFTVILRKCSVSPRCSLRMTLSNQFDYIQRNNLILSLYLLAIGYPNLCPSYQLGYPHASGMN